MGIPGSGLTALQRRLLTELADDFPHEDSVGVQQTRLTPELMTAAASLFSLGLIEQSQGWNNIRWLRLTEAGRQVEDGGAGE